MSSGMQALTVVTAVGSAIVGGVLFAFSGFVMAGLDRLRPGEAVAAMNAINVTAVRPPLMLAMLGTLAAVDPLAADTTGEWARYHAGWTAWNHVRTVAGVAAAAAFAVALAQ